MWLAGQQLVDGGGQGVGVVEVVLIKLEVRWVSQLAGGADYLGVQPLGVGVGVAGTLPLAGILRTKFLHVGPWERIALR